MEQKTTGDIFTPPPQHSEEMEIKQNLSKIAAIHEEQKTLWEKCRSHPFDLISKAFWQLKIETLSDKEHKLLKRNEVLHKRLDRKRPFPSVPTFRIPQVTTNHPTTGYGPIITDLLKYQAIQSIEQSLDSIYDKKDSIFNAIQHHATGIASEIHQNELDNLIRKEASLLSQLEELKSNEVDFESVKSIHSNMKTEAQREQKAFLEIKSIRTTTNKSLDPRIFLKKETNQNIRKNYNDLPIRAQPPVIKNVNQIEHAVRALKQMEEQQCKIGELNGIRRQNSEQEKGDIDKDFSNDE